MKSFISNQIHLSVLLMFFACFLFSPTYAVPSDKDSQQNKTDIEQIKLQLVEMQKEIDSLKIEFSNLNDSFNVVTHLLFSNDEEIIDTIPKLFDVQLDSYGISKIEIMNTVYQITGLGLKNSKELIDNPPSIIKRNLSKEEAIEIQLRLEKAGGTVSLVPKDQ